MDRRLNQFTAMRTSSSQKLEHWVNNQADIGSTIKVTLPRSIASEVTEVLLKKR